MVWVLLLLSNASFDDDKYALMVFYVSYDILSTLMINMINWKGKGLATDLVFWYIQCLA